MIRVDPHHARTERRAPGAAGAACTRRTAARGRRRWRAVEPARHLGAGAARDVNGYIFTALEMRPGRLAFAVVDAATGAVIGTTSYHDIVPAIDRVEIGYTWYAKSRQRSHVNTTCKLLLLTHAFETLGCGVVGLRTDNFNHASQAAIERLGAKKDGVIRHHACAATAPCATPSCTASCAANGRKSRRSCATSWNSTGPGEMLIDFFFTLQGRQDPGHDQGIPDPARSAGKERHRRLAGRLLLPVAPDAGEGRSPLRQVRPRLRPVLQGHQRRVSTPRQRHPARLADQAHEARADARAEGRAGKIRLRQADGPPQRAAEGAEGTPRRRQQVDRHRRHLAVRQRRHQSRRRPHRRQGRQPHGGQGMGSSAPTRTTTASASWARATSRSRCAACASSRARARKKNWRWTPRSAPPPATPAISTSRCSPSARTTSRC
jgi:RimJ/RimL family protein N-acetyltransferase